jgi:hypothetical protein
MPVDETSPLLPNDAGDPTQPRLYTSTDVDQVDGSHENGHAEEGLQETKPAMKIAAIVSADIKFSSLLDKLGGFGFTMRDDLAKDIMSQEPESFSPCFKR